MMPRRALTHTPLWRNDALTLTHRVLLFIERHPARTAWGIAKEISDDPKRATGTISSLLCRMARDGQLLRQKGMRGSWTYRMPRKTRRTRSMT